jgi:formamidopyrimidine-DNA glycosylase
MPELPEVEITRLGLAPHLTGQTIVAAVIRNARLRWPIPENLDLVLGGQIIRELKRRAKYLLVIFDHGTLILHLGMSGSLRILPVGAPPEKHDHFDLLLSNNTLVRLRDPRRFGAVLWHGGQTGAHPLLAKLGVEPLEKDFNADYLHRCAHGRKIAIKQLIMDSSAVVGVGNIYASEALFRAGIKPQLAAHSLSLRRCAILVTAIRDTLNEAIKHGGSSLRDFVNVTGKPGYFQLHYSVYGRSDEPCLVCGRLIVKIRQGQRSSFFCNTCQK